MERNSTRSSTQQAYTTTLVSREDGRSRFVWIVGETDTEYVVQPISLENWDVAREAEHVSKDEWRRGDPDEGFTVADPPTSSDGKYSTLPFAP